MSNLTSAQRKYLRSAAHHLDPIAIIGKKGLTDELIDSIAKALAARELIKVRFNDHKDEKKTLINEIAERTSSHVAGVIGHVGILYREHDEEEKRKIELPQ